MGRADIKSLPSLERLNELFVYDATSGDLRWKTIPLHFKRAKVGDLVGTIGARGYRVIGIAGFYYHAHRIIWKMVTGTDPVDQIDHIDGDRLNNRWENLRAASNGQNRWNTKLAKNNSSGHKGVSYEHGRSWVAYISAGGGQKRLGRFKSKEEAIAARLSAAEALHGEYMRIA